MKSLCKQRAPSPMIGKPNDIDGTIPIQNGRALWLKYIHDSFSKRKEIVMKQLKLLITLIGIMSVSLTIGSCVNEPLPEGINDTNNIKTFPEMSEKEGVLIDLASVMPGVLNDPELSKIIYESAKVHEEDEAYTLWSEIADKPTPSGKTIRQAIQQIQANLKTTSSTTSLFDSLDYLQVYIHAFELWDGVSPLPVTYTPLTIDDVDVTELTLYDTLGNETILEIDTTNIPDYPIAIVGLNEGAAMADEMGLQTPTGINQKTLTDPTIRITKLNLDYSANNYEPWWLGKAEIYFVHYVFDDLEYILNLVGNNPNTTVPQEIWNTGMGDRTDYKKYKCWKWSSYRYVQSKPWRTFNVNTGWDPTDINYNENYKFRVVEYDYPFYDRGVDYWCELLGITVQGASGANIVGIIIGYLSYLTCDILIINDDPVGDRTNFESIVQTAANNEGTVYQWDLPNRWKIKLKVQ